MIAYLLIKISLLGLILELYNPNSGQLLGKNVGVNQLIILMNLSFFFK